MDQFWFLLNQILLKGPAVPVAIPSPLDLFRKNYLKFFKPVFDWFSLVSSNENKIFASLIFSTSIKSIAITISQALNACLIRPLYKK